MVGKTILQYRILEKLGQGGNEVVYKATVTKLEHMVALKFLPPRIGADKLRKNNLSETQDQPKL